MKQLIKRLAVFMGKGVLFLAFTICRLFPKRDVIALMSRQSDDPSLDFKLLSKRIEQRYPAFRVVILSKKLANPVAYVFHMFRQTYYLAVSRAVVLDSFCIPLGLLHKHVKTPVVQMWHALGLMKKAGYALLDKGSESRSSDDANLFGMHRGYSSVLVSSMNLADDFAMTFNVDKGKLYEAPLPRVDALLSQEYRDARREEVFASYPELREKQNIVYCPTFRRVSAANEDEAMRSLIDNIDFETTNFIFQRHPVSAQRIDDPRVIQGYDPKLNMLFVADAVISDYSTVIYEAGLLDLPVYLYVYDEEEYLEKRELHLDLRKDVPVPVSDNAKELMGALYANGFDHDAFQRFIRSYIAVPVGQSCTDRIIDHLADLIKNDS